MAFRRIIIRGVGMFRFFVGERNIGSFTRYFNLMRRYNHRLSDHVSSIASHADDLITTHRSIIIYRAGLSVILYSSNIVSIYPPLLAIGCIAYDFAMSLMAVEVTGSTIFTDGAGQPLTQGALAVAPRPISIGFLPNEASQVPVGQLNEDFIIDNQVTAHELDAAREISRSTGHPGDISGETMDTFRMSPIQRRILIMVLAYAFRQLMGVTSLIILPSD